MVLKALPDGPSPPFPSLSVPGIAGGQREGAPGLLLSPKSQGILGRDSWIPPQQGGVGVRRCLASAQVPAHSHLCSHSLVQVYKNSTVQTTATCLSLSLEIPVDPYYSNTQLYCFNHDWSQGGLGWTLGSISVLRGWSDTGTGLWRGGWCSTSLSM